MKKAFIITLTLFLLALPAYAAQNGHENHANDNANEHANKNAPLANPTVTPTSAPTLTQSGPTSTPTPTQSPAEVTPTVTPTITQSVSPTVTSTPCDPTLQWKNHGAYVSCVAHLHEGGHSVSDAAKSDIGKKHEENGTPTPTIAPSPITSASPTVGVSPLGNLGVMFGRFFNFLKHLL